MNSLATTPADLSVAFVVERQQLYQSLVLRVLEHFPNARVFVGPDLEPSHSDIAVFLMSLERRLFRYPGRLSAPPELHALPDVPPIFDVFVDLRSSGPDKTLLQCARHDLWWIPEVDSAAILRGESSVDVYLVGQADAEKDARLISQARIQSKVMVSRTQAFALEKALQLIRRELSRVVLTGSFPDLGPIPAANGSFPTRAVPRYVKRVLARILLAFRKRFYNGWEPGRAFALRSGEGAPDRFSPRHGTNMKHPDQGWYADPFLLEQNSCLYCFFEDLPHGSTKASISVARVIGEELEVLGQAIETDYHLSFPFVFKHNGAVYMLPETLGSHRIEVWKSTDFPKGWQLYATAFEGQELADPVLVQVGSEWWLFANPCNDSLGDFSSELWLFQVDGPELREAVPHPLNPVVVGSDTARGGGRVMWHNDRLLRFSQDNSGHIYGYGLNIMEITKISATEYQEQRVQHVVPQQIPNVIGCHHIDFLNGRFVMDVRLP